MMWNEGYDRLTTEAYTALKAEGFTLEALNRYMQQHEPDHAILYTFEWNPGIWSGHIQFWSHEFRGNGSATVETYSSHRKALAAILRDRVPVRLCSN